MKKLILWAGCMAGLLLTACSSAEDRKSGSLETIPVADAFGNLQPLKVSSNPQLSSSASFLRLNVLSSLN